MVHSGNLIMFIINYIFVGLESVFNAYKPKREFI